MQADELADVAFIFNDENFSVVHFGKYGTQKAAASPVTVFSRFRLPSVIGRFV